MVGQEPVLFNRSIRDNIMYAMDDEANQEKTENAIIEQNNMIESAAKEADAHAFVSSLVDGYNTACGQRGTHLSGNYFNFDMQYSYST